jgi:hypothetical protein
VNVTCMPLEGAWKCGCGCACARKRACYVFKCESVLKAHPTLIAVCTHIKSLSKFIQPGVKLINLKYCGIYIRNYKF